VKRALGSLVSTALLGLGLVLGGAAIAPSAHAHSELVSSDPADGAALDAPPAAVSFTFNEDLLPDFVRFIATDPSGQTGDLPVSSVEGPTAAIDWPAGAPAGEWTVSYRVVSQDGHPIEGAITFSYAAPSPTASPTRTTAAPTESPTSAAPTSVAPTSGAPSPSVSPAADTTSSGVSGWAMTAIAVGVIVIVAVIIALIARRRA